MLRFVSYLSWVVIGEWGYMCEPLCSCFRGLLAISLSALKENKEIWAGKHSGSKGYTCEDNQSTVTPSVVSGHSVEKPSHSNRDAPPPSEMSAKATFEKDGVDCVRHHSCYLVNHRRHWWGHNCGHAENFWKVLAPLPTSPRNKESSLYSLSACGGRWPIERSCTLLRVKVTPLFTRSNQRKGNAQDLTLFSICHWKTF